MKTSFTEKNLIFMHYISMKLWFFDCWQGRQWAWSNWKRHQRRLGNVETFKLNEKRGELIKWGTSVIWTCRLFVLNFSRKELKNETNPFNFLLYFFNLHVVQPITVKFKLSEFFRVYSNVMSYYESTNQVSKSSKFNKWRKRNHETWK